MVLVKVLIGSVLCGPLYRRFEEVPRFWKALLANKGIVLSCMGLNSLKHCRPILPLMSCSAVVLANSGASSLVEVCLERLPFSAHIPLYMES